MGGLTTHVLDTALGRPGRESGSASASDWCAVCGATGVDVMLTS